MLWSCLTLYERNKSPFFIILSPPSWLLAWMRLSLYCPYSCSFEGLCPSLVFIWTPIIFHKVLPGPDTTVIVTVCCLMLEICEQENQNYELIDSKVFKQHIITQKLYLNLILRSIYLILPKLSSKSHGQ